jgi:hypothetical protein
MEKRPENWLTLAACGKSGAEIGPWGGLLEDGGQVPKSRNWSAEIARNIGPLDGEWSRAILAEHKALKWKASRRHSGCQHGK